MREHPSEGKPGEGLATTDEIRRAIESLTEADMAKLRSFAEVQAFKVRRHAWGVGAGDLLQEAIIALLEAGRRTWKPDRVSLMGALMGAMRSIASNWKRKSQESEPPPVPASDLGILDDTGEQLPTLLETARDMRATPEQGLLLSELVTEERLMADIEEIFNDDAVASLILEGWKAGMKGPEITASLGISRNEFAAGVRRIRRAVGTRWPKGKPYVQ